MNPFKSKGQTPILATNNVVPVYQQIAPLVTNIEVDLDKGAFLERSFYSVEEPMIISDAIPRDLSKMTGASKDSPNPVKTSFNVFNTFEEASLYAQRVNKPLVIVEIKPMATSKPQLALVQKLTA